MPASFIFEWRPPKLAPKTPQTTVSLVMQLPEISPLDDAAAPSNPFLGPLGVLIRVNLC